MDFKIILLLYHELIEPTKRRINSFSVSQLFDLYIQCRKKQGHKRTQPIEDGKKEIIRHAYAQNAAMVCATSVPWN